ncbi:MAG: T9SS type A sorting domain-containing protein [Bacteroidales bacterium]|jgi:hypothetical protein|nr:T9SS type A sorting domain-containing protein [Bacteroidales bacterium]
MKQILTLLLWLCIPIFCLSQTSLPREYEYDAAGNRIVRKVIALPKAPPAPPMDSLEVKSVELRDNNYELRITNYEIKEVYFVEKLAQVEMKIYPNPATEKITLFISNIENLQTGTLQLYSINGQLLQSRPIHSAINDISLVNLAKGAYILKVQINNIIENWKIIKQ